MLPEGWIQSPGIDFDLDLDAIAPVLPFLQIAVWEVIRAMWRRFRDES
jgi:hypothetical protein